MGDFGTATSTLVVRSGDDADLIPFLAPATLAFHLRHKSVALDSAKHDRGEAVLRTQVSCHRPNGTSEANDIKSFPCDYGDLDQ